jgi:hypothetical protein
MLPWRRESVTADCFFSSLDGILDFEFPILD